MRNISQELERLHRKQYPGALHGTLTADNRMDPFLAFVYDAIFVAAGSVGTYEGSHGISLDR